MKRLGLRVQQAMDTRQFSQEDLARLAGVHQSTISGIVNGKRAPNFENMRKIAMALGVSLDWLADLPPHLPGQLTPEQDELLTCYIQASDDTRKDMLRIVHALVGKG